MTIVREPRFLANGTVVRLIGSNRIGYIRRGEDDIVLFCADGDEIDVTKNVELLVVADPITTAKHWIKINRD